MNNHPSGKVSTLADEELKDQIARYVRGKLPDKMIDELFQAKNLRKIRATLISIKLDVERQLSAHKSRGAKAYVQRMGQSDHLAHWMQFKADSADWRAKAIQFLLNVEAEITMVNEQIAAMNRRQNDMHNLVDAIMDHYEDAESENDYSKADVELYQKAGIR